MGYTCTVFCRFSVSSRFPLDHETVDPFLLLCCCAEIAEIQSLALIKLEVFRRDIGSAVLREMMTDSVQDVTDQYVPGCFCSAQLWQHGSKMAIQSMDSNLTLIMEPVLTSKCLGFCIEARSLRPFAPETSGVELFGPFLETIPPTRH